MIEKDELKLYELKTTAKPIKEISEIKDTLEQFDAGGFIVAYLTYGVFIGRYENGNCYFYEDIDLSEKYIQKLRLFNESKELFIWRTKDILKGRLRIDNTGDTKNVIDAYQVLWGTDKQLLKEGWTRVFEERGTELVLPFSQLSVDDRKKRVFLQTRNYVDFHPETNIATYTDCRFVGFFDSNKNLLK